MTYHLLLVKIIADFICPTLLPLVYFRKFLKEL